MVEQVQTFNHQELLNRLSQPKATTETGGVSTGSHATDTIVAGIEKITGIKGANGFIQDANGFGQQFNTQGFFAQKGGHGLLSDIIKRLNAEMPDALAGLQGVTHEHVYGQAAADNVAGITHAQIEAPPITPMPLNTGGGFGRGGRGDDWA